MGTNPADFLEDHRAAPGDEVFGIGDLARTLGTTPRAIRFYEAKGLLCPRRVGTTRVYGRRERARLILILRGRSLGLSLRQIGTYLDLYGEGRAAQLAHVVERSAEMIADLEAKRAKIDETLQELRLIHTESAKKLRDLQREGDAADHSASS